MRTIITALQNEAVNQELTKEKNLSVISKDIFYQDGILEVMEVYPNIDFILMSELLPGEKSLEELIDEIKQKNQTCKIILILEKPKEEIEYYLRSKGNVIIFYHNEMTTEQLLQVIEEKTNQERMEKEIQEIKQWIKKEQETLPQLGFNKTKIEENRKVPILTKEEQKRIEAQIETEQKKRSLFTKLEQWFHQNQTKIDAPVIYIKGLPGSR